MSLDAAPVMNPEKAVAEKSTDPPPFTPDAVRIVRRDDGQYMATWGEASSVVKVCRCFPWTDPNCFISLRDPDDREIVFVESLAQLSAESRGVVEQALREASFVLEITEILELEEEYEIRTWRVHTAQGPRTFQTQRDEWPQPVASGGLLIRDVAGDLYHIAAPETLDPASRKRLAIYIE